MRGGRCRLKGPSGRGQLHDQHAALRVRRHVRRYAPQDQLRQAAPAMRSITTSSAPQAFASSTMAKRGSPRVTRVSTTSPCCASAGAADATSAVARLASSAIRRSRSGPAGALSFPGHVHVAAHRGQDEDRAAGRPGEARHPARGFAGVGRFVECEQDLHARGLRGRVTRDSANIERGPTAFKGQRGRPPPRIWRWKCVRACAIVGRFTSEIPGRRAATERSAA